MLSDETAQARANIQIEVEGLANDPAIDVRKRYSSPALKVRSQSQRLSGHEIVPQPECRACHITAWPFEQGAPEAVSGHFPVSAQPTRLFHVAEHVAQLQFSTRVVDPRPMPRRYE